MRWGCAVASLALAACLDAPPDGTESELSPDGGTQPRADIALGGLAARDPLTLDGRAELVLAGQRDGTPVAFLLSASGALFEDVTVTPVDLPFEPIDLAITRWGSLSGLAVVVSEAGALFAIDPNGALFELEVVDIEDGEPVAAQRVSDIDADRDRLLVSDGGDLYASVPTGSGEPGQAPLALIRLGASPRAIELAGASISAGTAGIGVIDADRGIHVYPFFEGDQPTIASDRTATDVVPDGLARPLWRLVGNKMIVVGIDRGAPRLWHLTADLGEVKVEPGTVLDGEFDAIHDLVMTRLDDEILDLILLVEVSGQLQVVVYLDPESTPDDLPAPRVLPVEGLTPPTFAQAMDAVLDSGDLGQNEIIVYDAAGRLACVDLAGGELASCGTLDLATAVTGSGASTSGPPGW